MGRVVGHGRPGISGLVLRLVVFQIGDRRPLDEIGLGELGVVDDRHHDPMMDRVYLQNLHFEGLALDYGLAGIRGVLQAQLRHGRESF